MTGTPSTINDLLMALNRFRSEEAALRRDYEDHLASLRSKYEPLFEEKQKKIEAAQIMIDEFTNPRHITREGATSTSPATREGRPPPADTAASISVVEWKRMLHGLTHIQALHRIAEENNGNVRVTEAKRILIAAGLAKGKPKNVPSQIYHLLLTSDQFEKSEPGVFRLVAGTPTRYEPSYVSDEQRGDPNVMPPGPHENRVTVNLRPQLWSTDDNITGSAQHQ